MRWGVHVKGCTKCVMCFRVNSGSECTCRPLLCALMVLLIKIEAICQNARAYSHCIMLDLQAIFTGCIRTNVHTQPQKEIHLKFLWGISLQFRETFKEIHRGITSVVDSIWLSFFHLILPRSLYISKNMHSGCTPSWATSHSSIIQKAVTAQAASSANDYLLEFVTPVKL